MTPAKTIDILRQLHDWLRGGTQWAPTMGAEAVETAIEMIERMDGALESLLIRCDDSDSAMYGTLSTSFVRDTVRIARGAQGE
jgi:hypothetical protein